jgi:D-glycero-D-manno-heptose 1,7-bisphosphate phosphatase
MRSPGQLRLLPRAAAAIRRLNEAGFAVVLATNQSGIARGLFTEDDVHAIHARLERRLTKQGAALDAIYYCPHHPDVGDDRYRRRCRCRKPGAGMLRRAARDFDLALSSSFAVGDSDRDLEAGRRAGCGTVLVRTGYGRRTEETYGERIGADYVAADLLDAAAWILRRGGVRRR